MTCNHEAPSVEAASARWAGKVQFVGVAWYGDDASFQGFVDKHGLTFPQISDDSGEIFARFHVPQQPAMAIIDAAGSVKVSLGAVEDDALDAALRTAAAA
ncbi:MAG: redoxin domain-containing protein [Ilumatobacteraceae bacterium]